MPETPSRFPVQWLAMRVFWLSFTIGILDRQLLAAVAPALKSEFSLSNADYGRRGHRVHHFVSRPACVPHVSRVG